MANPDDLDEMEYDEPLPPSPDDVALAIIQGLCVGLPGDADLNAVIHRAWAAVPYFYMGRDFYAEKIAPMFFKSRDAVQFDGNGNIVGDYIETS